jgi:acetyl-CoA carboxylase biotin carboxylase subunit
MTMPTRIEKVLIANRGEIASRIIRTCRAMGLSTVAIYSDPDATAPFVREADEAVYIGPPLADASFLAIDRIIDIAHRTQADAVHPGYGFLAENADFAQACADAQRTFIGPQPDAIRRMGRKIEAKEIMTAAGVPVIPGFSGVGMGVDEITKRIARLGYPVLLKASAGGGGKGMRIVRSDAELASSIEAARREARTAFGDDSLLVERYFDAPRHIEIQILGDHHGNLVHCFERECSIQRRHQKVIEEAPSPFLDDALREAMCKAALDAARVLEYRNAGTVEFVVDRAGDFYFLEVNTRLQVEHPVTEAITGLDLVRLQIMIAEGHPLPLCQQDITMKGHAIEARLYAEDPEADFLPATGKLLCWRPSDLEGVRYEHGVAEGSEVTIHYDPLLAKVIVHAPNRREATLRLARALSEFRAHGVRNNLAFLARTLRHPDFLAGEIDTHFIARHELAHTPANETRATDHAHAIAATLWLQHFRRARAPVLRHIPSGWRNSTANMQHAAFTSRLGSIDVRYCRQRDGRWAVTTGDDQHEVTIDGVGEDGVTLTIDAIRRTYSIFLAERACFVHSSLGTSELMRVSRFPTHDVQDTPGGCHAPMPGKVIEVRVAAGDRVGRGDLLVVLEAMKMEHQIVAPTDGAVTEVRVGVGQQVDAGDVLVVLEETPPAA